MYLTGQGFWMSAWGQFRSEPSLKESQQRWYLAGYDTDGELKTFGMDRMSHVTVIASEKFRRNEDIDIPSLFRESFGIWNNPSDPVEEIVLKYDACASIGEFSCCRQLH